MSLLRTPTSVPLRPYQQRRCRQFHARIGRLLGDGGAAGVVAVHAGAGTEEELGLAEGTDDLVNFGLASAAVDLPELFGVENRVHGRSVIVAAQAHRGSQPVGPGTMFWA